jgi:mannan endo-1,4-beta-mannosidase
MNLAAAPDAGGDRARLEAELDQMAAAGINHLRIMAGSEGSDSAPFRMRPALQPHAGEWDERLLHGLDRCLVGARQRGMRVTLVLGNTWFWSGGLAQYRAWAHGSTIPYPPAWNISAPPQRSDGFAGWGSYTGAKDGAASYGAYMRYVNGFYEDAPAQGLFEEHVLRIVRRTNSLTGVRYVDDPTILGARQCWRIVSAALTLTPAWEPINEPQATSVPDDTDPWHMAVKPNASDAMLHWHARTTALLKRHAPRQLVTSGFEGKQGAWYFKALHRYANVDFACGEPAHWPQAALQPRLTHMQPTPGRRTGASTEWATRATRTSRARFSSQRTISAVRGSPSCVVS